MTDDNDDLLRAALNAEADGVTAGDDLLDRVHSRAARGSSRRPRAPWLLAVAALVVIVGLATALINAGDDDQTLDVVDDAASTRSRIRKTSQTRPATCPTCLTGPRRRLP